MIRHLPTHFSKSAQQGAVFIELAVTILLWGFLLAIVVDYGRYLKEQLVLEEAVRFGVQSVISFRPRNEATETEGQYAFWRYREAITHSRDFLENLGLNADQFTYQVWGLSGCCDPTNLGCSATDQDMEVTVKIEARADMNRYVLMPAWLRRGCASSTQVGLGEKLCSNQGFDMLNPPNSATMSSAVRDPDCD